MCLYPKLVPNRHFQANKKNGGFIPECRDERLRSVWAKCGWCIECRQQRAREWQVRLSIEIEKTSSARFMTMTYSPEALDKLERICPEGPNEVARHSVRLFLRRWNRKYGCTVKHWLVTELGHEGTERLHLHGFLWTDLPCSEIEAIWSYGFVDTGEYVNQTSVTYCVKYVSKIDEKHPEYISKVFASPGLGSIWIKTIDAQNNRFNGINTKEYFRLPNGQKINLPQYFKRKLYTDEQREDLWINKMNKGIQYVCGEQIDVSTTEGLIKLEQCREWHRKRSEKIGYKKNLHN